MRVNALTGLRGTILIWVMLLHMPGDVLTDSLIWFQHNIRGGVDFFLAISGFLVTKSILSKYPKSDVESNWGTRKIIIKQYFTRRVARIFPAYYMLLLFIVLLAFTISPRYLENLKGSSSILASFPLFYANYTIPSGIVEHNLPLPVPLNVLWSISFQEQFYCLLALFFALFGRKMIWPLIILSFASLVLRLYFATGPWSGQELRGIYYEEYLHLNFDAIGWGCVFWMIREKFDILYKTALRKQLMFAFSIFGLVAVIATPKLIQSPIYDVINPFLRSIIYAFSILTVAQLEHDTGLFARFLKSRIMISLGNASFEIYLFHIIVYEFMIKFGMKGVIYLPVYYLISFLVGIAIHRFYSTPLQNRINR